MGGPLSVTFSDIFMKKMEKEAISPPRKPVFYKRFVDDIITNQLADPLFEFLKNYHNNIKLTCEISSEKFLDTKLIRLDNTFIAEVHRKETKLPHWSSCTPKRYKRNAINSDLSRAQRISSNFFKEKKVIREKFLKADYPIAFISSVIRDYETKQSNKNIDDAEEAEMIIPKCLFEQPKVFIMFETLL